MLQAFLNSTGFSSPVCPSNGRAHIFLTCHYSQHSQGSWPHIGILKVEDSVQKGPPVFYDSRKTDSFAGQRSSVFPFETHLFPPLPLKLHQKKKTLFQRFHPKDLEFHDIFSLTFNATPSPQCEKPCGDFPQFPTPSKVQHSVCLVIFFIFFCESPKLRRER